MISWTLAVLIINREAWLFIFLVFIYITLALGDKLLIFIPLFVMLIRKIFIDLGLE